jgi:hypothetical protein
MKVPYAKKWQKETDKLRQIALDCDLTEELKWGKPCFTCLKKNVAIVIPLKESCAFSFFKGALLKDPKRVLERIGEHTRAGRWIKFTSLREIAAIRSTLKDYLYEAIELEESGGEDKPKKTFGVPNSWGIAEAAGWQRGSQVGIRDAHTRPKEVIHFPRLICEAGKNQSSAGGKVRANDPERAWIPWAHMTGPRNAQIEFDIAGLFDALDAQRRDRMLSWQDVARELWDLSATLNARRKDHPISASTLTGMAKRRVVSQFRPIFYVGVSCYRSCC